MENTKNTTKSPRGVKIAIKRRANQLKAEISEVTVDTSHSLVNFTVFEPLNDPLIIEDLAKVARKNGYSIPNINLS
jgi:hypothetical protein